MCVIISDWDFLHPFYATVRRRQQSRRRNIQVHRLVRRRRLSKGTKEKARMGMFKKEMKIKNFRLYMENKSIMEENKRLRNKAHLLHQENKALLSQLQKISEDPHNHFARDNEQ